LSFAVAVRGSAVVLRERLTRFGAHADASGGGGRIDLPLQLPLDLFDQGTPN
jgi:hypothetical protein